MVTVTVTADEVGEYLGGGQRFTMWSGGEVGYGTISRQVYTEYSPS